MVCVTDNIVQPLSKSTKGNFGWTEETSKMPLGESSEYHEIKENKD